MLPILHLSHFQLLASPLTHTFSAPPFSRALFYPSHLSSLEDTHSLTLPFQFYLLYLNCRIFLPSLFLAHLSFTSSFSTPISSASFLILTHSHSLHTSLLSLTCPIFYIFLSHPLSRPIFQFLRISSGYKTSSLTHSFRLFLAVLTPLFYFRVLSFFIIILLFYSPLSHSHLYPFLMFFFSHFFFLDLSSLIIMFLTLFLIPFLSSTSTSSHFSCHKASDSLLYSGLLYHFFF